jgi:sugar lactone lactonase YvrE
MSQQLVNSACTVALALLTAGLPARATFGQNENQKQNLAPVQMRYPLSAVVAADGTIYVADRNLPGIWRITDQTPQVFFRADAKFGSPLNAVRCVALDQDGRLLAGDSSSTTVYRFDDQGKPQPAHIGRIGIPVAIAVSKGGDIFVADLEQGLHAVRRIPAGGGAVTGFAKVQAPRGMTIDDQDRLYVVQHVGDLLIRLDREGKSKTLIQGQPLPKNSFPAGIVVGKDGTVYFADGYGDTIWKIPPAGQPQRLASGSPPFAHPVWLTWRGDNLLVIDPRASAPLIEVTLDGKVTPLTLKIPAGP